jgi:fatty acid desaturase
MKPHDELKLEHLIHQTLRALPDRKAPRSLESRVLAGIAARQALPWWRQPFAHWPLAVRAAFLVLAGGLAAGLVLLGTTGSADLLPAIRGFLAPLAQIHAVATFVADLGATVFRSIPPLWLYGVVAFVATLYAALFGLGATAYRTLIVNR